MALQSGVSAEAISSVYFKINQIAVKRIILRSQIRRFWLAVPFNPRALRIDQLCLEPFHYDFLVVRGIRSVALGIRRLCLRLTFGPTHTPTRSMQTSDTAAFIVSIFHFGMRLSSLMKRDEFDSPGSLQKWSL